MDSKLMMVAYSNYLDQQLQRVGASVRSYAVHPGFVKTRPWDNVHWVKRMGFLQYLIFRVSWDFEFQIDVAWRGTHIMQYLTKT
jgi:NAD(P)-dependent dehydrogenase (short-subunit alcohol dehydrogenase family)